MEFESKNYTQYRSIETELNAPYKHAEKFNCFTPAAVRQLESELFQKANEITNRTIDQIQKLAKYEAELLAKYGLPQVLYSITGQVGLPD